MFCSLVLTFACFVSFPANLDKPFVIEVVDQETKRGVPLVELSTVNGVRFLTDSAGIVAVSEPDLMNEDVFFHVKSHGYEFPKDGFGFRGKRLKVVLGGAARLEIKRINIAERLYRTTGAGVYRDTILAGRTAPIKKPLLNAKVFGSDSVQVAIYRGKLHWFWGDTNRPSYPLGNFHTPHATSPLVDRVGLDPERGIDFEYDVDKDGFAAPSCKMPGDGPTWIDGLMVVKDKNSREHLFAKYVKIKNMLDVYECGMVEWDDSAERFRHLATFPKGAIAVPAGHPFRHQVNGTEYFYFPTPFPTTRVKAEMDHVQDLSTYEVLTWSKPTNPAGRGSFSWKPASANVPAFDKKQWEKSVKSGLVKIDDNPFRLRDVETGKAVAAHGGSINWNEYRKRWVLIAVEAGGTSFLGEVWFAEADSPLGPWAFARKIVTHDRYSFYNPKQHPFFDKDGGRIIFFEGTYTNTFSGNPAESTPRYDYNQIMYRLDLADARLNLPIAVYKTNKGFSTRSPRDEVAFFAWERPNAGMVSFARSSDGRLHLAEKGEHALFHSYPIDTNQVGADLVALREYRNANAGSVVYSTEPLDGFTPVEPPLCLVKHASRLGACPQD